MYSGAPLRLQGRVVGTLCVFLRGIEGDGDIPVAMKAVLEAEAAAFNADLNAVVWWFGRLCPRLSSPRQC